MDSEVDFVVAPPEDRFCPVCTELLTEPFLSDCGHHVCRECHERIMATRNTRCPVTGHLIREHLIPGIEFPV